MENIELNKNYQTLINEWEILTDSEKENLLINLINEVY